MNVNVLFKILTFNIFLNITNGCCCLNPKPDDANQKHLDAKPKLEDGKKYIAEVLGINEDDFLDIQMFDDDNNLREYIEKIQKSSLKYSSFVVLEIFKFDKEIKGHKLACQYMEELSEKKCFYCAFIRENVEIKINNDLLELDYDGYSTLDKNLETINNEKKLRHLHIIYSTINNDTLYFCKKNSINI